MTGGTGGSTRPTIRCPMTPTDFTCLRLGVTVRTTLTWLPGTCFSRAGGTRYCSTPPRVWTIIMPRPMEVLTELAPTSWPWTSRGSDLRSFSASRNPGPTKLASSAIGSTQASAAATATGQS